MFQTLEQTTTNRFQHFTLGNERESFVAYFNTAFSHFNDKKKEQNRSGY